MAERRAAIFGTEKDQQNCPFYLKIGACRHGDRCSRLHNKPVISQTILLPNLYQSPISKKAIEAAGGQAPNLSDAELQQHFDEFYEDIFEGLAKYGQVDLLNVCANLGDHLVGNVYVKYQKEDDANESIKGLKGRFYDGRPILSEFSPVTDFGESRCRQYDEKTCVRGGFCNFMHLHSPSKTLYHKLFGDRKSRSPSPRRDSYRDRDRDYSGARGRGGYDRDYRDRDYGGGGGGRGRGGYDRDYRDRDYGGGGRGGYDRDYRDRDYGRNSSRDSYDRDRDRRPYGEYDRNSTRGSKSPEYSRTHNDQIPPPISTTAGSIIPPTQDQHYRPSIVQDGEPHQTTANIEHQQPILSPTSTIQAPLSTGTNTVQQNTEISNGTVAGEKRVREDESETSEKRLKSDSQEDASGAGIQWASNNEIKE